LSGRAGFGCWRCPVSYINEPRLRTIEPHPEKFGILKVLLERFATGKLSLTAFSKELTAAGIVGERRKKPIVISAVEYGQYTSV